MAEPILISEQVRIPAEAIRMRAVRSGGPGGQNVNKVASKVELRVDLALVEGMSEAALLRLRTRVRNQLDAEGLWIVTSSRTRDQLTNLEDAREKIRDLVTEALVSPVTRRATRPTRGSQVRRVEAKKAVGQRKQSRQRKDWD
nr:alternative ribosome rescue aminoacyl-tRNA hydrolase ArfB [uncultured Holophaga sp.]